MVGILHGFADEARLRILRLTTSQELYVNELVDILKMSQPRVSRHLGVLRRAGLVHGRREGNLIYYRCDPSRMPPPAADVWRAIGPRLADEEFFPGDAERLREVLSRRKERSREYFDAVLSEWDRIKRQYIQDVLPLLVVSRLIEPGAAALDVGTGTGEALVTLAQTAGRVIGVDSSERMLAESRRRVAEAGAHNVELKAGDAEDLPVADGECDLVLASMVLHHLPDPRRGAAEMVRVTREGGRVVVIDLVRHEEDWAREIMADVWLGFTERQVRDILRDAGLDDVTYSTSNVASPIAPDSEKKLQVFVAVGRKTPCPARDDAAS